MWDLSSLRFSVPTHNAAPSSKMLATMSDSEKTQRAGKDALNFTKAATEALPMPEKGCGSITTTRRCGLAIGIGPSGVKTFILDMKVNRKKERMKIGRYPI